MISVYYSEKLNRPPGDVMHRYYSKILFTNFKEKICLQDITAERHCYCKFQGSQSFLVQEQSISDCFGHV